MKKEEINNLEIKTEEIKTEMQDKIELSKEEILQVENFDLKQQMFNLNQKIFQTEIKKMQDDYDNLNLLMNSYFKTLIEKYNVDPEKYVINLSTRSFERKND